MGIADQGWVNVIDTVMGPVVATTGFSGNPWADNGLVVAASRNRARASASSASPSWNVIPGRSSKVHTVKSALGVIDFARYGCQWLSRSITTRGSSTDRAIW